MKWKKECKMKLEFLNKRYNLNLKIGNISSVYDYNKYITLDGSDFYATSKKEVFKSWENCYDFLTGLQNGLIFGYEIAKKEGEKND